MAIIKVAAGVAGFWAVVALMAAGLISGNWWGALKLALLIFVIIGGLATWVLAIVHASNESMQSGPAGGCSSKPNPY